MLLLDGDIEWKPSFIKAFRERLLCYSYVRVPVFAMSMQICHFGIPGILKSLLEDDTSVKVGVSIPGDAAKMWREYEVLIEDLEELGNLVLESFELDKSTKVRMSNWEAKVLSKAQLEYAATDAYASWYMYQVVSSLSDAEETKDKDENREETKDKDEN